MGASEQFNEANSIISVMLVTSLLREIQESGWKARLGSPATKDL